MIWDVLMIVFMLVVFGWLIGSGDRQVFHRPDPDTDPPDVRVIRGK